MPEEYFTRHLSLVNNHPGEVKAELTVLRIVKNKEKLKSTVLQQVYLEKMQRGVPPVLNPADVYGMTHDVFNATDFGRIKITGYDKAGWTAMLKRLCLDYATYPDILGEVLLAAKCLDIWGVWADTATAAFRLLWTTLDRTAGGFNENYHPLLVGDLLFAMLEQ